MTCSPPSGGQIVTDPVLLIEILSPSNAALTRENVWAYSTIPSVAEILLLGSVRVEAELLRRGRDGSWPEAPLFLGAEDDLELASIGFRGPLRAFYRTHGRADAAVMVGRLRTGWGWRRSAATTPVAISVWSARRRPAAQEPMRTTESA